LLTDAGTVLVRVFCSLVAIFVAAACHIERIVFHLENNTLDMRRLPARL
jgi:hypothetical protein